jgi:transcription initiation factor IIE alpha subunit
MEFILEYKFKILLMLSAGLLIWFLILRADQKHAVRRRKILKFMKDMSFASKGISAKDIKANMRMKMTEINSALGDLENRQLIVAVEISETISGVALYYYRLTPQGDRFLQTVK